MKPVQRGDSLYGQALETLREGILDGSIPPGTVVSAPELAALLGVSRTPIRDAILQLQKEGLVAILPRQGILVVEPTVADLEDLFRFREPLEGMAAALAAQRIDREGLQRLQAAFESHEKAIHGHDLEAHLAQDEDFHEVIAQSSRSRRIEQALRDVRNQLRVYTRTLSTKPGAMDDRIIDVHRAIVKAIRDGDARAAESAARAHVRGVLEIYIENASVLPEATKDG